MINMVRLEIGRNIKRWKSLVSFLLMLATYILAIKFFEPGFKDFPIEHYNFYSAFLYASGAGPKAIIAIMIPLIAALIAGDSLAWDQKTKYGEFSLIRTTYRKYIISKIISVSITSFSFVFLSELLVLLYSYSAFPYHISTRTMEGYIPTYAYSFFQDHLYLHLLIIIINISLLATVLSLISLFISIRITNLYVVLFSPLLLFIIGDFSFRALGLSKYAPFNLAGGYLLNNFSYRIFEIPLLFLTLWSILCIVIYFSFAKRYKVGVPK